MNCKRLSSGCMALFFLLLLLIRLQHPGVCGSSTHHLQCSGEQASGKLDLLPVPLPICLSSCLFPLLLSGKHCWDNNTKFVRISVLMGEEGHRSASNILLDLPFWLTFTSLSIFVEKDIYNWRYIHTYIHIHRFYNELFLRDWLSSYTLLYGNWAA